MTAARAAAERAKAISCASPEDPCDSGRQEQGGGLGQDHQGGEQAKCEYGGHEREAGAPGSGCASLLRCGVRGGEESEQGEEDEQGLEDGQAGEDITEGADGEEQDGDSGSQRGASALSRRGAVLP